MASPIDRFAQNFAHMTQRERLMVGGLGLAVAVLLVAVLGYLIMDGLDTRRQRNERIRHVIKRLEKNRHRLVAGRTTDTRLERNLNKVPPKLQTHISELAEKYEVEIKDFKPDKAKPIGKKKRVLMKSVEINIFDVPLDKFMKLLAALESGRYLIMTTHLQMSPRRSDRSRLDIRRLRVASYEWNNDGKSKPGKKPKGAGKPKKGDKSAMDLELPDAPGEPGARPPGMVSGEPGMGVGEPGMGAPRVAPMAARPMAPRPMAARPMAARPMVARPMVARPMVARPMAKGKGKLK